jgi:hypothetical protein
MQIHFFLRAIFLKTVLDQNESPLGDKRLLFSDSPLNFVRQYGVHLFVWTSFRP